MNYGNVEKLNKQDVFGIEYDSSGGWFRIYRIIKYKFLWQTFIKKYILYQRDPTGQH